MTHGKTFNRRATFLIALFALLLGAFVPDVSAQRRRPPSPPPVRYFTVPADTVIRVRMDSEINSRTARVGDRFLTTVTELVSGGVIPVGSKVRGRVISVKRARGRTPGTISVSFYQVELPAGARYTINGSLTSLQADDVNSDNESTVSGRSNRKRDAVFIGGGATTGAIIGGAAGTGARVYERESEADVKSGTEFGVILNRAVSLPEFRAQ